MGEGNPDNAVAIEEESKDAAPGWDGSSDTGVRRRIQAMAKPEPLTLESATSEVYFFLKSFPKMSPTLSLVQLMASPSFVVLDLR